MQFASVVVDISTRALHDSYVYAVPDELEGRVDVGATVLVTFGRRPAVGYVVSMCDSVPMQVAASSILPVQQLLAEPAFDSVGSELADWIAREYACNPCDALRLFLAPGQKVRVRRNEESGKWELEDHGAKPVDDRWVSLSDAAADYAPRANASRQKTLLDALSAGPVRMAELNAVMTGAASTVRALQRKGVVEVVERRLVRGQEDTTLSSARSPRPQTLTVGQVGALKAIQEACDRAAGDVVLVDGVTGSGKTEVYLQAIEETLRAGKGAIVLVPEISLTAQTVGRFRARFGQSVSVLHSRLSVGERYDQWDMVRRGETRVVVGARSALFAPLSNVGLVIVDEEHEGSYKQDNAPRYHAREVAAELARKRGCALVLGSATPSLESLHRCDTGTWRGVRWTRVSMPERPGEATMPEVQAVNMTEQFSKGSRSIFSAPLVEAIKGVVKRREKAVLMLNRRGFASFLMCRECGCVPECPHCSTSLTYHERNHMLACHTCGRGWPIRAWPDPSTRCPNCGSRYMGAFGVGTQRVEDELNEFLSRECEGLSVDVLRMDADTTQGKGAHQRILEAFDASECAVLVGTQMIAKGLDFPEVTLVGVINADTTLKLPDFRAGERTYDLLEQVAGRAGRGKRRGKVIVQSYWAAHPAIQAAVRHDRSIFLEAELAERSMAGYPPYNRLSNVTVWGRNIAEVERTCNQLAQSVRDSVGAEEGWEVIGPADCVKSRIKDRVRKHFVVKSPVTSSVGELLGTCTREASIPSGISVAVDVDAHDLM